MDARVTTHAPVPYLLHLADNALVLGQRNAEWCGHAPILEEDMAMANNSLDLIGQARLLYQHAAERINAPGPSLRLASWPDGPVTEDTLAYLRDVPNFANYTLLELPHTPALVPAAGSASMAALGAAGGWIELLELQAAGMLAAGQSEVMDVLGRQFESALIKTALKHTHGRKNDAAVRLGIGRNTITRKIAELGIDGAKDE